MEDPVGNALERRFALFSKTSPNEDGDPAFEASRKAKIACKVVSEYKDIQLVASAAEKRDKQNVQTKEENGVDKVVQDIERERLERQQKQIASSALVISSKKRKNRDLVNAGAPELVDKGSRALQSRRKVAEPVAPKWHSPWKLSRVIAGHTGWVRCVAVDPSNQFFFTGSNDRMIKCWDMASGKLKLTLTAHSHAVRGLAISKRYPYLFSVGDDKTVKCWDLETNKVIRKYHGHLQGVTSVAVHPNLDVFVSGSRDASARVWDIRSRQEVHLLTGHEASVESLLVQGSDPQVITGSMDKTIKLWDLAAGKCMTTLTNHKKGVRALARNPLEFSFASGSADCIKKWECKQGRLMLNLRDHNTIINALSCNQRDVLFSGGNDGTMRFWDYGSGHCFQESRTIPQPGSLDSEACILASTFDMTGSRLITCEADKSIKMWKEDGDATETSHPLNWDKRKAAEAMLRERF
uniref:Uncharacterized protein n=2 Tax=Mucochytrium quahogii TaxID=96639 RepID=A0A7S2SN34_9STRA|mmetsp:Transcript_7520/g.16369  ORF Transcript_7520/g.16369 Transcript_7520/m.16369 type:complete len:466 (+) Transcript_7520:175-1572(+)